MKRRLFLLFSLIALAVIVVIAFQSPAPTDAPEPMASDPLFAKVNGTLPERLVPGDKTPTRSGVGFDAVDDQFELAPLPGLTMDAQDRANEAANRYVLPVSEFLGEPDVGNQTESASGGRRLPKALETELERDATAVTVVRLNKIGLARLNALRVAQGLPTLVAGKDLQIAPVGQDLVTVPAAELTSPKAGGATDSVGGSGAAVFDEEVSFYLPKAGGAGGVVDNSALQYFPPIRDQGSVDSCVGWSEIYYATTHAVAMACGWDAKNGGDDYRLSPMFTYNFLNEGRDQYTYFTTHFDIARYHGVVRWSEMPNSSDYLKWVTNPDDYFEALRVRTDGYSTIYSMNTTGLDTLKAALDNGHVAAFATFFRGWVFDVTDNDPNTTEDDAYVGLQIAHNLLNTSGGHGMVIVGYNDHIWLDLDNDGVVDANEKGGFKVANSDGTGWKNGGFCYITYDIVRQYSTIVGNDGDGLLWSNRVRIAQAKTPQHEPSLVARVTLNHNKRNQVKVQLGTSATSSTTPSLMTSKIITDTPYEGVLQGGAYAFSGAAAAYEDFTYYLDFSDTLPALGTERRFYVQGTDWGSNDGDLTIKSFELYYKVGDDYVQVASSSQTPVVANGSTQKVWVDWTVGDVKPVVSLEAMNATAAEEGQDTGVWRITRSGDTANSLTVYYGLDGTATLTADYTVDAGSPITIPAGETFVDVTLTPVDDEVYAEFESAEMALVANVAYVVGTPDPVSIAISDNDNHAPLVAAGPDQSGVFDAAAAWSPALIATTGWYDASDAGTLTLSGSAVTDWADKSGNDLHLSSPSGREPTTGSVSINGKNALDFTNDEMVMASNPFGASVSDALVIAVHRVDNDANQGTLFTLTGSDTAANRWQSHAPFSGTIYFDCGGTGGGSRLSNDYGTETGDFVLLGFYGSVTDSVQRIYKNGALLKGDTTGHTVPTVGNIAIGSAGGKSFQDTSFGELLIINGTVSTEVRQNLEGYLAHKWGLQASLPVDHPYKATPPGGAAATVDLSGSVSDADGQTPTVLWSKVSGPGKVLFVNESVAETSATFTEPGTYVLRLTADDGFGPVSDDVTVTVTLAGGDADNDGMDDQWESDHFGDSATIDGSADADGDGLSDYFEYLFDSDPNDAGSRGFPLQLASDAESGQMVLEWEVRDRAILGTDYLVCISTDLVGWDPLPSEHCEVVETPVDGELKTHCALTITHDYGDQLFIKLVKDL